MRQQREAAIRQVLRSPQVSLAALFCGQREGLVSATRGLFFPRRFFVRRPSAVRPTWGQLMRRGRLMRAD